MLLFFFDLLHVHVGDLLLNLLKSKARASMQCCLISHIMQINFFRWLSAISFSGDDFSDVAIAEALMVCNLLL